MAHRDLVVVGTSAGGLEALQELLRGLPEDFDAAILVVLHTSNHPYSMLPRVLERAGRLPVIHPKDKTRIEKGHVYVACPDYHMIVEDGVVRVLQGPRENLHRPAVDPLFRSAAYTHGRRVIGVVLTGALDDGTSGLMVIRRYGGEVIVQDPSTALFRSMPASALEQVPEARSLTIPEIAKELVRLTKEEIPEKPVKDPPDSLTGKEIRIAEFDMSEIENEGRAGQPSAFACPDCGGVLWEIEESGFLRFRCRVGHAFTARHLGAEQTHAIETALWAALRALEESASLYRRMAERADNAYHEKTARRFHDRAANVSENARVLRDFLLQVNEGVEERTAEEEEV